MNFADFLLEKGSNLDKDFLAGSGETATYRKLNDIVNRLSYLIYTDIGTNKEIALLSENSFFYIVSFLSIIKSGNIAILLETTISNDELNEIIKRCSLSGFFIQNKIKNKFNLNFKVYTEMLMEELPQQGKQISIDSRDDNVAVIVFTSGSTGKKKGVMLTHGNLIANTNSIIQYLNLSEDDRICVVLPFFYVYGASLLYTHLRVGGSIVISRGFFMNCLKEIDDFSCTGFAGVPSTYQLLINKTDFLNREFPSLRYLTQAGGKLADNYIIKIADAFPKKLFFVMYGATEATARLSYLEPSKVKEKLGSIGKAVLGVTLTLVNENGQQDTIGEIVAEGKNIMKGYYKDTDFTRQVLKNNRLFTGDMARIDKEGYLYIIGRKNRLIKSAGYRISPFEIENIVSTFQEVLSCAIFSIPDKNLGEAIILVVETNKKDEKFKNEIMMHCNRLLPSYKVPKDIMLVDKMVLQPSNKVDIEKMKILYLKTENESK